MLAEARKLVNTPKTKQVRVRVKLYEHFERLAWHKGCKPSELLIVAMMEYLAKEKVKAHANSKLKRGRK